MRTVTAHDLRNQGEPVLERVAARESFTVAMDGRRVAELRSLTGLPLPAGALLARWRRLPAVDPDVLRADIDRTLDTSL